MIIVPGALCMMITGPLSGFLSDRIGWRWFTMGGMGISCAGLLILSNLQPDSPVPLAMAGMICQSMGVGFFNAPNNSSVLSAVEPSKHGAISGFLNLVRNSGNLCSIAIATAIVTATMGARGYEPSLAAVSTDGGEGLLAAFTTGLRYAYLTMAVVVFLGIIASAFKGRTYELGESRRRPARRRVGTLRLRERIKFFAPLRLCVVNQGATSITTRPPTLTSTRRLYPSRSSIPISGVAPALCARMVLGCPSQTTPT